MSNPIYDSQDRADARNEKRRARRYHVRTWYKSQYTNSLIWARVLAWVAGIDGERVTIYDQKKPEGDQ